MFTGCKSNQRFKFKESLMKRAGFTMIELIFVIVILGILAAVALPKFAGVSDQAQASKCDALVGTLNRTVGPSMWSASIANGLNGSISTFTNTGGGNYLDPDTYIAAADIPTTCIPAGTPFTAVGTINSPTFGTTTYDLKLVSDGTVSEAPRWSWAAQ